MQARYDPAGIEPPDDSPGRFHVLVTFASTFGAGRDLPARIKDHQGREWLVETVVDFWKHPDHMGHRQTLGPGQGLPTATRYLLEVVGPLPHAHGSGLQRVWLRSYGGGDGWYMRPDDTGQDRTRPDGV